MRGPRSTALQAQRLEEKAREEQGRPGKRGPGRDAIGEGNEAEATTISGEGLAAG